MEESRQRIEVEIPRSQLIVVRRLHNNAPLKESIESAIATFTNGWQAGIELTKEGISEICSLLNAQGINSEKSLIAAIMKRLNVSPRSVLFEVDETLAVTIRRKATGNGVNFSEYVSRFVHSMFRYGILDWHLKSVFFDEGQWNRIKKALGTVPSTGENFAKIFEEWAHMKGLAAAPAAPEAKKDTRTADDRNREAAIAADAERKRKMEVEAKKVTPVAPVGSPEYREKMAAAMDKATEKPGKQPAPEEVFQEAEPEVQAVVAAEIPNF